MRPDFQYYKSSVGLVTREMVVEFKKRFSSPTKHPDVLCRTTSHLLYGYCGTFSGGRGKNRQRRDADQFHLVPKLRGAIPLHSVYAFMACKDKAHPRTDHEDPEGRRNTAVLFL